MGIAFEVEGRTAFAGTGGRAFAESEEPVVVLIHGAGMDHTVWALQSRYLAHHGRRVLALDLPGHGRSAGEPLGSIAAWAGWVVAALDALGVEKARLAGHSMGALIALELAATAPGRVERIALLGAAAAMPVHPDLLAAAERNEDLADQLVAFWGHGGRALKGGNPTPGMWMLGGALSLLGRAADGALFRDLAACNDYADGEARAAAVACPALVILGDEDRMAPPKAARKLASLIPHGLAREIAGSGHMMTVERPDATLEAMKEFL